MKFRRKGPYKKNRDRALLRHMRPAASYVGDASTLDGRIGIINRFEIYVSNCLIRDKRQFRRWRRKQKKAARTRSQSITEDTRTAC